jgi:uncharacterized protein YneF (UPF0154 family)
METGFDMKRFKVWLLLTLVFLAGFAGGIVATRIAVRHFVRQAMTKPELVRNKVERDLIRKLRLDAGQREQVRQILRRSHQQIQELRREFQPQFADILQATRKDISAVLTPAQQQRFEQFQAENETVLRPAAKRD